MLVFVVIGCSRPPAPVAKTATAAADAVADTGPVRDALRKPHADADGVRAALDQLGSTHRGRKPTPPGADDVTFIKSRLGASDAELAEITRADFGPLDTAAVSQALLFRDLARTLDVAAAPPAGRLHAAVDWLVRHVRRDERPGPPDPPAQVALRGRGTTPERVYVLVALLHQLGLESYAVGGPEVATDASRVWGVGVVNAGDVWLIDARSGLALPGPKPGELGTLAALSADPAPLRRWTDAGHDVTRDITNARLYFAQSWSALAPRLKAVESLFPAGELRLTVDLGQLRKTANTLPLTAWGAAFGAGPRLLTESLPPAEGGTDRAPQGSDRAAMYASGLIPWDLLPSEVIRLPGPTGIHLRGQFASIAAADQQPGLAEAIRQRQTLAEVIRTMKSQEKELPESRLQDDIARGVLAGLRSGADRQGPTLRQLLLRGQYQEAITAMVSLADQLRTVQSRGGSVPADELKALAEKMQTAHAESLRAQRSRDPAAIAEAAGKTEALAKLARPLEAELQARAAGATLARLAYLTAAAKHDQAAARQRREPAEAARAWPTVVAAWRTLLANYPNSPEAVTARRQLALALDQSGQREAAEAAYRDAANKTSGPEKAAAEILAR